MAAISRGPGRDEELLDKVRSVLQEGGPLGDAFGLSGEDRDALYAVACDIYSKGQYEWAQQLFGQLSLYDHNDPRYMKGLAATTQMLGDYEQAVQMYAVVITMDMSDPAPVMHAGDCLKAMGRHAEAVESFDLARSMCSGEMHEQVKRRCKKLLGELKQRT